MLEFGFKLYSQRALIEVSPQKKFKKNFRKKCFQNVNKLKFLINFFSIYSTATFVYTTLINDKVSVYLKKFQKILIRKLLFSCFQVQLPCDINPPTSDDQILLVLWYKDDQVCHVSKVKGRGFFLRGLEL